MVEGEQASTTYDLPVGVDKFFFQIVHLTIHLYCTVYSILGSQSVSHMLDKHGGVIEMDLR